MISTAFSSKCKCVTKQVKQNLIDLRTYLISWDFDVIRPFPGDTQDVKEDQWFVRVVFTDIIAFPHEMFASPSSRVRLGWSGEYQAVIPREIGKQVLKVWSPSLGER